MPTVTYVGGPLDGRIEEQPDQPEVSFKGVKRPAGAVTQGHYRSEPWSQGSARPTPLIMTWCPTVR